MGNSLEQPAKDREFTKMRYHDLRHTANTQLAESNVPLPVTMSMVGHMDASTTAIYTHISDSALREAVEKLQGKGHFVEGLVEAETTTSSKHLEANV